ncbi:MAG: hypothetical protein WDA21_03475 [Bacilli bacterium]
MNKINEINNLIKNSNIDVDLISDGWHTFGELYKHRQMLLIKLCQFISKSNRKDLVVWKTRKHNDNTVMEGYFLLGITINKNNYISYHMDNNVWDLCAYAIELDKSPIVGNYNSKMALQNLTDL